MGIYFTILEANNENADQTVQMHKLICIIVVCIWQKPTFSGYSSNYDASDKTTNRDMSFKKLNCVISKNRIF